MRVSKEYDHESYGCLIEKARASQSVRGMEALDQYARAPEEFEKSVGGICDKRVGGLP